MRTGKRNGPNAVTLHASEASGEWRGAWLMNARVWILIAAGLVASGCGDRRAPDGAGKTGMAMDSTYQQHPEATVLRPKDTIRLDESLRNLEDYPNITRADLDAVNRVASKEIVYVKRGDEIRLAEPKTRP